MPPALEYVASRFAELFHVITHAGAGGADQFHGFSLAHLGHDGPRLVFFGQNGP
ncbi:MAG TPA: hypothetical protein PKK23_19665 [Nitrospirales bacterium]|nr:hypothetical protein [Nitrospirales bacterium]